mmetsp:Transcript_93631/g.303091  ORF Transcript_93631/g.303091 Transcript_93631/m.303091 type:complete len:241 (+) Transcript_93631:273-995(+)
MVERCPAQNAIHSVDVPRQQHSSVQGPPPQYVCEKTLGSKGSHRVQDVGHGGVHRVRHHVELQTHRAGEGVLDDLAELLNATERPRGHPNNKRSPPAHGLAEAERQGHQPQRQKAAGVPHVALRDRSLNQSLCQPHGAHQLGGIASHHPSLAVREQSVLRVWDLRGLSQNHQHDAARAAAGGVHQRDRLRGQQAPDRELMLPPTTRTSSMAGEVYWEGREQPADAQEALRAQVRLKGTAQ